MLWKIMLFLVYGWLEDAKYFILALWENLIYSFVLCYASRCEFWKNSTSKNSLESYIWELIFLINCEKNLAIPLLKLLSLILRILIEDIRTCYLFSPCLDVCVTLWMISTDQYFNSLMFLCAVSNQLFNILTEFISIIWILSFICYYFNLFQTIT